jgi:hypothetical protein
MCAMGLRFKSSWFKETGSSARRIRWSAVHRAGLCEGWLVGPPVGTTVNLSVRKELETMSLSLRESRAVTDLAELLYDFLPGSGNPNWKGHVSFKTVAEKVGVGTFWQAGSKTPMITALLEKTLEHRRDRFESLIVEVVRAAITSAGPSLN